MARNHFKELLHDIENTFFLDPVAGNNLIRAEQQLETKLRALPVADYAIEALDGTLPGLPVFIVTVKMTNDSHVSWGLAVPVYGYEH